MTSTRGLAPGAASAALLLTAALLGPASYAARPAPGPAAAESRAAATSPAEVATRRTARLPRLKVRRLVRGLANPWDVQPLPTGELLVTERDSARLLVVRNRRAKEIADLSSLVWVSGETGLMSMAVDPDFATNHRVLVCHGGTTANGGHDVRITRLTLADDLTSVVGAKVLLSGIDASSGRHGGCRLLIDRRTGALLVGTGDAAVGTNPRDLTSLAGKVLRIDRTTGEPWPTNPFADAASRHQRMLLTFGHRNVQGLAQRADGTMWSAEHGPDRDDEINRLVPGGDYGWNPVPGYNESVPMTDQSLPGRQRSARWRSGYPTLATSGIAWVHGRRWGRLNGALAIAALKGSRLLFATFDRHGSLRTVRAPKGLRRYGRLRSVTALPDGRLLVTTSNGSGDAVLEVTARR